MKTIFKRVLNLVCATPNEWQAIVQEGSDVSYARKNFLYPFMVMLAIAQFMGTLIEIDWNMVESFEYVIKRVSSELIVTITSFFAGLYLSVVILTAITDNFFVKDMKEGWSACFRLIVYSSSIVWVVMIVTALIPSLFILKIFMIYAAYIVWVGVPLLFPKVKEDMKGYFTVIAFLLLSSPVVVRMVMLYLMK